MIIKSITLRNFRCFGDNSTTIELSEGLTAFVGANGAGKTAVMIAFDRLFGTTTTKRTICKEDFHLPPNVSSKERRLPELYIDAILGFPELNDGKNNHRAIPQTFNQMIIEKLGYPPICRIRLEANWKDDGTAEGYVQQNTYWVTSIDNPPPEERKYRMDPQDRGLIQSQYIPAIRNPSAELKYTTNARVGRLLNAISWTSDILDKIRDASNNIQDLFDNQKQITMINEKIQYMWGNLNDDPFTSYVKLSFSGNQLDEILRNTSIRFIPESLGDKQELGRLSDGQLSLLYLSLVSAIFRIERETQALEEQSTVTNEKTKDSEKENAGEKSQQFSGFQLESLMVPALTVFSFEELENHLAPHLLARSITSMREIINSGEAQVLISTHSPVLMGRIDPDEVRYFRLNPIDRTTIVRKLILPDSPEDAAKYVRGALKIYPEIYFAKLVILAEGPSEEVVLPKISESQGFPLDRSFTCVLPIGGRHVNLLWKLLTDLNIPFLTLLDLDVGRESGGWAKIKYVVEQLQKRGVPDSEVLSLPIGNNEIKIVTQEEVDKMHRQSLVSFDEFSPWIKHLEKFGVYFSFPLDLDMSMLQSFPDEYTKTANGGPNIPSPYSKEYDSYIENAISTAVGSNRENTSLYKTKWTKEATLFPWYRYLFLNRSKPSTHIQAVAKIPNETLWFKAPESFKRLIDRSKELISAKVKVDDTTG